MNIRIGNQAIGDRGEYVGRPTPLGNPFRMQPGPEEPVDQSEDAAEDGDDWWPELDSEPIHLDRLEPGEPIRQGLRAPGPGHER